MKRSGRPRTISHAAIQTPLSQFLDANWDRLGLTNDESAMKLGIKAPNLISMWRTGRTPVGIARLPQLAAMLNVDLLDLFLLWLKQQRLRDNDVPTALVEGIERRLISPNEAEVIAAIRNATRNSNPKFRAAQISAFAKVAAA